MPYYILKQSIERPWAWLLRLDETDPIYEFDTYGEAETELNLLTGYQALRIEELVGDIPPAYEYHIITPDMIVNE